jgi:hypothetical protein
MEEAWRLYNNQFDWWSKALADLAKALGVLEVR